MPLPVLVHELRDRTAIAGQEPPAHQGVAERPEVRHLERRAEALREPRDQMGFLVRRHLDRVANLRAVDDVGHGRPARPCRRFGLLRPGIGMELPAGTPRRAQTTRRWPRSAGARPARAGLCEALGDGLVQNALELAAQRLRLLAGRPRRAPPRPAARPDTPPLRRSAPAAARRPRRRADRLR